MKRLLIQIAICLILGAITTVLGAWAFASWTTMRAIDLVTQGCTTSDDRGWMMSYSYCPGLAMVSAQRIEYLRQRWGDDAIGDHQLIDPGTSWVWYFAENGPGETRDEDQLTLSICGWPAAALWCEIPDDIAPQHLGPVMRLASGCLLTWDRDVPIDYRSGYTPAALPVRPVWRGLIVDIALYGALWCALLSLRRAVRTRTVELTKRSLAAAVVACAVLAPLTTITVAWAFAHLADERYAPWGPEDGCGKSEDGPTYAVWSVSRDQEPGSLRLYSFWESEHRGGGGSGPAPDGPVDGFLPYWTDYLTPSGDDHVRRILDARGWPMLAMWGGFEVTNRTLKEGHWVDEPGPAKYAIVLPRYWEGEFRHSLARVIPLAPIWPGFIVDAIFYAALWLLILLLLAGPGVIRRTLRHRRGRCLWCAYDLRGAPHDNCPECGRPVSLAPKPVRA